MLETKKSILSTDQKPAATALTFLCIGGGGSGGMNGGGGGAGEVLVNLWTLIYLILPDTDTILIL